MAARSPTWVRQTVRALVVCVAVLVALDLVFTYFALVDDEGIRDLFNLAREGSIPNWFSSVQEAGLAVVLWLVYRKTGRHGFAVLAGFFLYLSLDDGAEVHERVATAVADFFAITASAGGAHEGRAGWLGGLIDWFPSYSWQVLFGPFFLAFAIFMVVFLSRALDRRRAWTAYVGVFLYGAAQIQDFLEGYETPYAWLTERLGVEPYTVSHFAKVTEESVEMLATTILVSAFLAVYAESDSERRGP